MKWLVEVKRNEEGDIIERKPLFRTDENVRPRGRETILVDGVDTKYPLLEEDQEGNFSIVENSNEKTVSDAYIEMDEGIVTDLAPVLQTKVKDGMFREVDTAQLYLLDPETAASKGLKARLEIASFLIDDPLDTAEKIREYYLAILWEVHDRAMIRVVNYMTTKAATNE